VSVLHWSQGRRQHLGRAQSQSQSQSQAQAQDLVHDVTQATLSKKRGGRS